MKIKNRAIFIMNRLWLSAPNPGATVGLSLCVLVFGKYLQIPFCGKLRSDSWLVKKLKLEPIY